MDMNIEERRAEIETAAGEMTIGYEYEEDLKLVIDDEYIIGEDTGNEDIKKFAELIHKNHGHDMSFDEIEHAILEAQEYIEEYVAVCEYYNDYHADF